jgi:hypothetical protein
VISAASVNHVRQRKPRQKRNRARRQGEKRVAKETRPRERIFQQVSEGCAVDPARARKFDHPAEGVARRHQKPRTPINAPREEPIARQHLASAEAERLAFRDQRTEQKDQPDVRQRRVADEIIAIEQAGPAVPQEQRDDAPPPSGHERDAEDGQRNQEGRNESRCAAPRSRERIRQDPVCRVDPGIGQNARGTEQFCADGQQPEKMLEQVRAEDDSEKRKLPRTVRLYSMQEG